MKVGNIAAYFKKRFYEASGDHEMFEDLQEKLRKYDLPSLYLADPFCQRDVYFFEDDGSTLVLIYTTLFRHGCFHFDFIGARVFRSFKDFMKAEEKREKGKLF